MHNLRISKGVGYMLLATLLFSFMQLFVKWLDHIPFYELIFFRAAQSLILCSIEIRKKKLSPWGNNKPILIARGLFGVASLSCFFYALQNVPMGTVLTIVNIKPFLVLIAASILLKEKVRKPQWLFFLISFIGVVAVKGFDTNMSTIGLLSILGAATFAAFAHTFVRKLRHTDQPIVVLFYFTLITVPIIGPFALYNWVMPTGWMDWLMVLGIGLTTHFAQLYLTKAYQSENVANISNIYYLGIVYGFMYGYWFFDETFQPKVLFGLGVVIIGVFLNIWFVNRKKVST